MSLRLDVYSMCNENNFSKLKQRFDAFSGIWRGCGDHRGCGRLHHDPWHPQPPGGVQWQGSLGVAVRDHCSQTVDICHVFHRSVWYAHWELKFSVQEWGLMTGGIWSTIMGVSPTWWTTTAKWSDSARRTGRLKEMWEVWRTYFWHQESVGLGPEHPDLGAPVLGPLQCSARQCSLGLSGPGAERGCQPVPVLGRLHQVIYKLYIIYNKLYKLKLLSLFYYINQVWKL